MSLSAGGARQRAICRAVCDLEEQALTIQSEVDDASGRMAQLLSSIYGILRAVEELR